MTLWYKYPYTSMHDINLDWIIEMIKDLKEKVDQMDMETLMQRLDQVDEALGALESDNVQIKAGLLTAQGLITQLRNDLTADEARIDDIESTLENIDVILQPLSDRVSELSTDVTELSSQVENNTGRIEALEDATLNAPILTNENLVIINDFRDPQGVDYSIELVTDNGHSNNPNIYLDADGRVNFKRATSSAPVNEMALVLHNVIPKYAGGSSTYNWQTSTIFSFGMRFTKQPGSTNGTTVSYNVTFGNLTGATPFYVPSENMDNNIEVGRTLQLKPSTDGDYYDLWIYNGYLGEHLLNTASMMIHGYAMINRGFTTETTGVRQQFFISLFGGQSKQINSIIDKKTGSLNTALRTLIAQTDTALRDRIEQRMDVAIECSTPTLINYEAESYENFFIVNHDLEDVTIYDASTMVPTTRSEVVYQGVTRYIDHAQVHLNGSFILETNLVVNQGGSYLEIGTLNGSSLSTLAVLAPTVVLTIPNLGLTFSPYFSEMRVNPDGKVLYRLSFDDTNFDWATRGVTVLYSGVVNLYRIF